jgi:hypothetical protein
LKLKFTLLLLVLFSSVFSQIKHNVDEFLATNSNKYEISEDINEFFTKITFNSDNLHIDVIVVNDIIEYVDYEFYEYISFDSLVSILTTNNNFLWKRDEVSTSEFNDLMGIFSESILNYEFGKFVSSNPTCIAYILENKTSINDVKGRIHSFTHNYLNAKKKYLLKYSDSSYIGDYLLYGYKTNSTKLLEIFFDKLSLGYKVSTKEHRRSTKIIENTYLIFEDIYNPFNIDRIAKYKSELNKDISWNEMYKDIKYMIIQDEIGVKIRSNFDKHYGDYIEEPILDLTIENFRPIINIDSTQTILLNELIEQDILYFLGNEQIDACTGNIMNTSIASGESQKRKEYLRNCVKILHGHWFGWHLLTHPDISSIDFNQDLTEAEVHFRVRYQGGLAEYKKIDEKWKLVDSLIIWIE